MKDPHRVAVFCGVDDLEEYLFDQGIVSEVLGKDELLDNDSGLMKVDSPVAAR